ncbi:hypothetical protein U3516DRAFT_738061 [Neocallimastix sp. 'constans']
MLKDDVRSSKLTTSEIDNFINDLQRHINSNPGIKFTINASNQNVEKNLYAMSFCSNDETRRNMESIHKFFGRKNYHITDPSNKGYFEDKSLAFNIKTGVVFRDLKVKADDINLGTLITEYKMEGYHYKDPDTNVADLNRINKNGVDDVNNKGVDVLGHLISVMSDDQKNTNLPQQLANLYNYLTINPNCWYDYIKFRYDNEHDVNIRENLKYVLDNCLGKGFTLKEFTNKNNVLDKINAISNNVTNDLNKIMQSVNRAISQSYNVLRNEQYLSITKDLSKQNIFTLISDFFNNIVNENTKPVFFNFRKITGNYLNHLYINTLMFTDGNGIYEHIFAVNIPVRDFTKHIGVNYNLLKWNGKKRALVTLGSTISFYQTDWDDQQDEK